MTDSPKNNRVGRSAGLVQGLGLLAAGVVAAAIWILGVESGEAFAVIVVASAAALVFFVWSGVLALRAVTGGEKANWPLAIFILLLIEIALPCLALWSEVLEDHHNSAFNFMIWLGLPVFGPFVAIASAIAAPVALWRARKVDAAEYAAGVKAWRRRTWKVGLAWYVGVMVALGVVLLPGPLFLLGACAGQFYHEDGPEIEAAGWGAHLAEHMPNVVRDGVESVLHAYLNRMPDRFLNRIHSTGRITETRLIERFEDESGNSLDDTWQGLGRAYPDSVTRLVDQILQGKARVVPRHALDPVTKWVARHGTAKQMKLVLAGPLAEAFKIEGYREIYLNLLRDDERAEAILPELEEVVESKDLRPFERDVAFEIFANCATRENVDRIWSAYLVRDFAERKVAAENTARCLARGFVGPMLKYLGHSDVQSRRAALIPLAVFRDGLKPHLFRNAKNAEHLKLTRRLFELLDDSDSALRLAAACVLGDIFREGEGDEVRNKISQRLCSLQFRPDVMPIPDPDEIEELTKVKAAVGKWLRENAGEK